MDISIRPIHPVEYSFLREMLFEAIFDPEGAVVKRDC